jgi:nickel/cobalt transporter (NicO) family protein
MQSVTKLVCLVLIFLIGGVAIAAAGSSLGIGSNEVSLQPHGMFGGFFGWINGQQKEFYRSMTGALKAMRDDGSKAWLLVGLSFAYGIFHAAGPGHGKAVISSYMVANEVTLRRGILLSFISAFLQAISALVIVGLAFLVLRGTTISMDDATHALEVASFAMITAFGAYLLWTKIFDKGHTHADHAHAHSHVHDENCDHGHGHNHEAAGHKHAAKSEFACDTCGHIHAPDPQMIAREFNWKTASAAVFAVGLRPCSGALIILTFAILNGLYIGGIMSVLAMALGTAITVSTLATLAVTAKNVAMRYTNADASGRIHRAIEIFGAGLVFVFGLTLLLASLAG